MRTAVLCFALFSATEAFGEILGSFSATYTVVNGSGANANDLHIRHHSGMTAQVTDSSLPVVASGTSFVDFEAASGQFVAPGAAASFTLEGDGLLSSYPRLAQYQWTLDGSVREMQGVINVEALAFPSTAIYILRMLPGNDVRSYQDLYATVNGSSVLNTASSGVLSPGFLVDFAVGLPLERGDVVSFGFFDPGLGYRADVTLTVTGNAAIPEPGSGLLALGALVAGGLARLKKPRAS